MVVRYPILRYILTRGFFLVPLKIKMPPITGICIYGSFSHYNFFSVLWTNQKLPARTRHEIFTRFSASRAALPSKKLLRAETKGFLAFSKTWDHHIHCFTDVRTFESIIKKVNYVVPKINEQKQEMRLQLRLHEGAAT